MNKTNNAIFATIFVAMVMTTGLTTTYVFPPSPAVLYEPVEGENPTQGQLATLEVEAGKSHLPQLFLPSNYKFQYFLINNLQRILSL